MTEAMRAQLAKTFTAEKAATLRELVRTMEAESTAFLEFRWTKYPAQPGDTRRRPRTGYAELP